MLEILGSTLLGLGLAAAAERLLTDRLPGPRTVLLAGGPGALFGAWVSHMALGPGHPLMTLLGAVAVSVVMISLLLRPSGARMQRALPQYGGRWT